MTAQQKQMAKQGQSVLNLLVLLLLLILSVSVSAVPMSSCNPKPGTNEQKCKTLTKQCKAEWNVIIKWTGPGTKVGKKSLGDAGCQCNQYCGFKSKTPCTRDKQCFWNTKVKPAACFNKVTQQAGGPILTCLATSVPTTTPTSSPITLTPAPTTLSPTTQSPITSSPTTASPTTSSPTTASPSTSSPTTAQPTTSSPTTASPTTASPTTASPTTASPTTASPTTASPTTASPTTASPTTASPTTASPTTASPTTASPTTASPTTASPTTSSPTTASPTTASPTTSSPTTATPTSSPTKQCNFQAWAVDSLIGTCINSGTAWRFYKKSFPSWGHGPSIEVFNIYAKLRDSCDDATLVGAGTLRMTRLSKTLGEFAFSYTIFPWYTDAFQSRYYVSTSTYSSLNLQNMTPFPQGKQQVSFTKTLSASSTTKFYISMASVVNMC